jgi:lysylphosphatidylglycerol synthetase-like protein (DUF2156 family)
MANYIKATNFTAKDALPGGNAGKIIKGTEIDVEYTAIATAIASKADTNSPTFTGTPLAPTANSGTNTTQLATTAFVTTAVGASFPSGGIIMWSGSIALSLLDGYCVMALTALLTFATDLLWGLVQPMLLMLLVALRMQRCQRTRTQLHRWSQIQVTNIRFHQVVQAHQTMPLVALLDHFLHHKQLAFNQPASQLQQPTTTQEPLALTLTYPRTMHLHTL